MVYKEFHDAAEFAKANISEEIEKARAAGIGDDLLNALVAIVSAVNAGVAETIPSAQ